MTTDAETHGSWVGTSIVWTPLPGMLKWIADPGWALASVIAWRSDPAPLSFTLVTVKVSAPEAAARTRAAATAKMRILRKLRWLSDFGMGTLLSLTSEPRFLEPGTAATAAFRSPPL